MFTPLFQAGMRLPAGGGGGNNSPEQQGQDDLDVAQEGGAEELDEDKEEHHRQAHGHVVNVSKVEEDMAVAAAQGDELLLWGEKGSRVVGGEGGGA